MYYYTSVLPFNAQGACLFRLVYRLYTSRFQDTGDKLGT